MELTDLAVYRRALEPFPPSARPQRLRYRDFWNHEPAREGGLVQVEGRIVRRFRQGAIGTFPPLVEAWAVTPLGEPYCWVYPENGEKRPFTNQTVRFEGTYLRKVRYEGGDVARVAPLIVGPRAPVSFSAQESPDSKRPPLSRGLGDWVLGGLALFVVVGVLIWQYLNRPVSMSTPGQSGFATEPRPKPNDLFEDGDPETQREGTWDGK